MDAGSWTFPGEAISAADMNFMSADNRNDAAKFSKLSNLLERGVFEELGRKPNGFGYNRLQPLFNSGQKFVLNSQRPCFLYLIDDTTDSDFVRFQLRARESRRSQIDEQAADWQGSRFGYAWVDLQELLRDIEAGTRPYARWARDLLLSIGEAPLIQQLNLLAANQAQAKMNAPAAAVGNENFHYGVGGAGAAEMMVTYPMMNGTGAVGMGMYDGTPGGLYMPDPGMQYVPYPQPPPHPHHPHHPHQNPYFYPPQQMIQPHYQDYRAQPHAHMAARAGVGAGQLRFRFPAHVLSLEVRTTGPRLHRDWIVSVGAALVSIQSAGAEPQVFMTYPAYPCPHG
jgi:hypothetical protein